MPMTNKPRRSNATAETPTVVLIGGTPRSGTTVVADLLNECPEAAIMAEYRLIDLVDRLRPILDYELLISGITSANLTAATEFPALAPPASAAPDPTSGAGAEPNLVSSYETFGTPDLHHELRYPTTARFPQIVADVVRSALNKPDAAIIGSKTPGSMLRDGGDQLGALFPTVRYIALLRSPLDQINSSLNRRNRANAGIDVWHIDSVSHAIREYMEVVRDLISLRERVGDALLFVKYEDLLADPSAITTRLLDHVGLGWQPGRNIVAAERGTRDVLSTAEQETVERSLGSVIDGWAQAKLTGTSDADLSLLAAALPPLPTETVRIGGEAPTFLAGGWSSMEPDGVWSEAASATMIFGSSTHSGGMLKIEFLPYLATGSPLHLELWANGTLVGGVTMYPGDGVFGGPKDDALAVPDWTRTTTLWLGPVAVRNQDANIFEFRMSGRHFNQRQLDDLDPRTLGIRLSALQFVPLHLPVGTESGS